MSQFKRISCNDAKKMMVDGEVNIADIRDLNSFNAGHINDAEHLDDRGLADYIEDTEKDEPLIVCCYHGNSSQSAAAYLAEQGFKDVYSLDGGYEQWAADHPDLCEKE